MVPKIESIKPHPALTGDAPKRLLSEDEFGMGEMAQAIAMVIRSRVSADGYAIGIEGRWGSGKTTLLNFVEHTLLAETHAYQKTIRFDPWLIGNKFSLLAAFFEDLVQKIEEFRSDTTVRTKIGQAGVSALDRLRSHVRDYSKYVRLAATAASSASAQSPSLSLKMAALGLSLLSGLVSFFKGHPPTLEVLKQKIVDDLRVLSKLLPEARITVLIDDTDRLEPDESVEILRLIKAVANFPLVTYLVCFDMKVLSAQALRIVKVGDGADYLEKVFQQIVPIPPQEPFALRRFVRRLLAKQFPTEMADGDARDLETSGRQDVVFDRRIGKLVHTPRDAVRLCDNVSFGWPLLSGRGDFLDYVWLQLIKLRCRPLYEWTRDYVTNLGSYRDGGRPGDAEPTSEAAKLRDILGKLDWGRAPDRSGITTILPGLKNVLINGTESTVFNFTPPRELFRYESGRRLGSPSHWRFYFAFEKPSYALDDTDIAKFRRLAALGSAETAQFLNELAQRPHSKEGFFLEILFDRLEDQVETFTSDEQIGMARAFSDIMDDLPRGAANQFTDIDPWKKIATIARTRRRTTLCRNRRARTQHQLARPRSTGPGVRSGCSEQGPHGTRPAVANP